MIRNSGSGSDEMLVVVVVAVVVATNGSVDEGAGSAVAGCSDSCER